MSQRSAYQTGEAKVNADPQPMGHSHHLDRFVRHQTTSQNTENEIHSLPKRGPAQSSHFTSRQVLLDLQRKAGNRALNNMLGATFGGNSVPTVQRFAEPDSVDRDWLISRITYRMNAAFTKYVDACNQHQRRLRALADAKANIGMLILEIPLTFISPRLSSVVNDTVAKLVPTHAEYKYYKLALAAMDNSEKIVATATSIGKHMAKSEIDHLLQQSEKENFVEGLKQVFSVALDFTHGDLVTQSDMDLCVIYANYDPRIVTTAYYAREIGEALNRYEQQVQPMQGWEQEKGPGFQGRGRSIAYWVRMPSGRTFLARIFEHESLWAHHLVFQQWITKSMASLAKAKTEHITGEVPQTLSYNEVENIPEEDLLAQ